MRMVESTVSTLSILSNLAEDFPEFVDITGTMPAKQRVKIDQNVKGSVQSIHNQAAKLKGYIMQELHEIVMSADTPLRSGSPEY